MYRKFKTSFQIFFFLALSAGFLMSLAWLFSIAPQNKTQMTTSASFSLTMGKQAGMLVGVEQTVTSAQSSTLAISKKAISSSASVGSFVDFIILITNTTTSTISNISFAEIPDSSLSLITGPNSPEFSNVDATSTGDKIWNLNNLAGNTTARITITTQLLTDSKCDVTAQNKVQIAATDVSEIEAQDQVVIAIQRCTYLPYIRRDPTPTPTPTPTPLYVDNFSNSNSGWPDGESDNGRCDSRYDGGTYRIDLKGESNDAEDCFRPAPGGAEYRYGLFEVQAQRTGGDNEFVYGIYINGQGGDEYYLFRVSPANDCGWDFIRRKDGDSDTKLDGGCDSAINRNSGINRLSIRRHNNGQISVYVNDKLLGTYVDGSQLNNGKGTGVYVLVNEDRENTIRFDNFTVKQENAATGP